MLAIHHLFSDNMVIQHGVEFPVWGRSAPGAEITVTLFSPSSLEESPIPSSPSVSPCLREKKGQAIAGQDGAWRLTLEPVPPGGPYSMEIAANGEKLTLGNIYSGDVWMAAGQSNMEMPMLRIRDNYPEEWQGMFPPIHQFKVLQEWDFSGPRKELRGGCWQAASKETLNDFSGVAWFFAKAIYEKHKVPIGIINTAWGGTPIETWMSPEALASFPAKAALASMYADETLCNDLARTNDGHIREWEELLMRQDRGLAEKWYKPETAISPWNDITLPGDFADAGLTGFCGVIWLCRDFEISAEFAAQDANMWLGTIVDADTVFVNGREAGGITYRYPPRKNQIPAGLLAEGKNRIAIRVSCNSGDGGITRGKSFSIFSKLGCVDLSGTWKYRIGMCAPARPEQFFFQRQPGGAYNAMIAPLLQFPVKGVIWYQGESNDRNPLEYVRLFKSLIQDWRTKTGQESLPFIFVQLPIFGAATENDIKSSWAAVREAQQSALSLPNTGMAAALDAGEWNDLHPLNKKDVGLRLALAAEKLIFGSTNTAPGPMLRTVKKGQNRLLLGFDNCGSGLVCRGSCDSAQDPGVGAPDKVGGKCPCRVPTANPEGVVQPQVSAISPNGQKQLPIKIESADTISIDLSSVDNPQTILYAWANNPLDRQLFNGEGLPMLPFRVNL